MPRILVIDDDEQIRSLLRAILEREGYEVETAADGVQGLKLFRKDSADLVITDILMPEKEGLETIRELCDEFPDVKIIAISGGGSLAHPEVYLELCKKFGALRTFQKPVDRHELVTAVREIIG